MSNVTEGVLGSTIWGIPTKNSGPDSLANREVRDVDVAKALDISLLVLYRDVPASKR